MSQLSENQLEAIRAFICKEKTAPQIASEFGISRQAFYKWLRKDEAKEFIEELRTSVVRECSAKAIMAANKAIDKIEQIVDGNRVDPAIVFAQIQAATLLLNISGVNKNQSEVKHEIVNANPYEGMSPEQIREELKKLNG